MCSWLSRWLQEDSNLLLLLFTNFPQIKSIPVFSGSGPNAVGGILARTACLGDSKGAQCQFMKWLPFVRGSTPMPLSHVPGSQDSEGKGSLHCLMRMLFFAFRRPTVCHVSDANDSAITNSEKACSWHSLFGMKGEASLLLNQSQVMGILVKPAHWGIPDFPMDHKEP